MILLGFAGGFAVCWFFKDKIVAVVSNLKAKFDALRGKF